MASRRTQMSPMTGGETPSPTTTVPGRSITDPGDLPDTPGDWFTQEGSLAGGVTENYKPPASTKFGDPNNPYLYSNQDWQLLLLRPKEDIINIQNKLAKAFPDFQPGRVGDKFDNNTIYYFKKALARINTLSGEPTNPIRGKNTDQALTYLSQNPAPGETSSSSLPTYRLTSTDDLKAVFARAAQDSLGRTISDRELQRLADAYNREEKQYQQRAAYGGTVMQAPQASTFGTEQIEEKFAVEAEANDYANYIGVLSQMMAGG
jgi:hypothetical protein